MQNAPDTRTQRGIPSSACTDKSFESHIDPNATIGTDSGASTNKVQKQICSWRRFALGSAAASLVVSLVVGCVTPAVLLSQLQSTENQRRKSKEKVKNGTQTHCWD